MKVFLIKWIESMKTFLRINLIFGEENVTMVKLEIELELKQDKTQTWKDEEEERHSWKLHLLLLLPLYNIQKSGSWTETKSGLSESKNEKVHKE